MEVDLLNPSDHASAPEPKDSADPLGDPRDLSDRIETWDRLVELRLNPDKLIAFLMSYLPYAEPYASMLRRGGAEIAPTPACNANSVAAVRSPVEAIRDQVRAYGERLVGGFEHVGDRLPPCIVLKAALRELEQSADRYGYERLSRVAAILHDTLRYNPIEAFDDAALQSFMDALGYATEGRADAADPVECEHALLAGDLTWLPPIRADR
jgi:hypothetical protein